MRPQDVFAHPDAFGLENLLEEVETDALAPFLPLAERLDQPPALLHVFGPLPNVTPREQFVHCLSRME